MLKRILTLLAVCAMVSAANGAVIAYYTGDGSGSWVNWNGTKYANGWNTAEDGSGTDLVGTLIDPADTVMVTQGIALADTDMGAVSVVNVTGTGIVKVKRNGLKPSFAVDGGALMASTQYNNSTHASTTLTIAGGGVTFLGDAAANEQLNVQGVMSGTAPVNINGGRIRLNNPANDFVSTVNVGTGAALILPQAQNTVNGNDVVLAPGGVYWMHHNGDGWNTTQDIYGTNGSSADPAWMLFGIYGSKGPWASGGNKGAEFRGVTFGAGPKDNGDGTGLLRIGGGFRNDDANQNGSGATNALNVWVGNGTADQIIAEGWSMTDNHGSACSLQLQFSPDWTDGTYTIVDRTGWAWANARFLNDFDLGGGLFQASGMYDGLAWSCDVTYTGGADSKDIVISNVYWVPEPATLGLLCIGGIAALIRRRR